MLSQLKAAAIIATVMAGKQVYDETMLDVTRQRCDEAWTSPSREVRANACNRYIELADKKGLQP